MLLASVLDEVAVRTLTLHVALDAENRPVGRSETATALLYRSMLAQTDLLEGALLAGLTGRPEIKAAIRDAAAFTMTSALDAVLALDLDPDDVTILLDRGARDSLVVLHRTITARRDGTPADQAAVEDAKGRALAAHAAVVAWTIICARSWREGSST